MTKGDFVGSGVTQCFCFISVFFLVYKSRVLNVAVQSIVGRKVIIMSLYACQFCQFQSVFKSIVTSHESIHRITGQFGSIGVQNGRQYSDRSFGMNFSNFYM